RRARRRARRALPQRALVRLVRPISSQLRAGPAETPSLSSRLFLLLPDRTPRDRKKKRRIHRRPAEKYTQLHLVARGEADERGGEKSERDGARVAEKHARRRKIVRKEAYVRGRDGGGGERHDGRAGRVRGHGQRAEADHRHAAGKAIRPIHEVEEIRHPGDG